MLRKFKYFLKRLKINKRERTLGPFTKGILYQTKNGLIAMPHKDIMIGKHLAFKGSWNLKEIESLRTLMKEEDTIYMLGTHVGTLLIPLSQNCKTIYGYEANPNTFWFLQQNILLNHITNTRLFNLAIGNESRKIKFYKNEINTGGSKIKPKIENLKYIFDNPEEVEVEMVSLDDHIEENNFAKPDGIIMDIEGAEYMALLGMEKSLKQSRFLFMEYVPHHLKNVAGITNIELIKLIEPHFDRAISAQKQINIDMRKSSGQLLDFLNSLEKTESSDDLIFIKDEKA